METYSQRRAQSSESGFSLPEVLIVVLLLSIVTGAIFGLINQSQARYIREVRLMDSFGQARTALEQMVHEIHKAGYPALNLYASSATAPGGGALNVATAIGTGEANNNKVASTFLLCQSDDVVFEADLDGDGVVERVQYQLQGTTLLRRVASKNANGTLPSADFIPLVEGVVNPTGTPVFACNSTPTSSLPAPRNTGSVAIRLHVESSQPDPETRVKPRVTLSGYADRLNPDS